MRAKRALPTCRVSSFSINSPLQNNVFKFCVCNLSSSRLVIAPSFSSVNMTKGIGPISRKIRWTHNREVLIPNNLNLQAALQASILPDSEIKFVILEHNIYITSLQIMCYYFAKFIQHSEIEKNNKSEPSRPHPQKSFDIPLSLSKSLRVSSKTPPIQVSQSYLVGIFDAPHKYRIMNTDRLIG